MTIELVNGDCLQYMATLEDNSFDLAVVDPPYRDVNHPTKDMRANGSMKSLTGRPSKEYWNQLFRVSKNQIIWGANNFELPQWKGFLVWKKKRIGLNFTMSMCEIASLSENLGTVSKWIEIAPQNPNRIHPTQKPIQLYQWIFDKYTKKGMKILDTHLGSGLSAIAAHDSGLNFVGIELDADYFQAAKERLETHQQQLRLFT